MRIAISIFGRDRPGIIATLTSALADKGANIEDASMTLLQGHFAMILVISIDKISEEQLSDFLTSMPELEGFSVSFSNELGDLEPGQVEQKIAKYIFHLSVSDTPGIVAKVTEVLGNNGANVVDCATRKNNATGVFSMILDVDVLLVIEDQIVEQLGDVAKDFSGDVVFQRVDDVDL